MDPNLQAFLNAFAQQAQQQDARIQSLLELVASQRVQQPAAAVGAVYSLHKDLSDRMEKFHYDAEDNATFEIWYARYETIFTVDAVGLNAPAKVDLMTEQLSTTDYQKFANTILPLTKATIPFDEAVKVLKRLFGRKESKFSLRYKCFKVEKSENEDYADYAARVNLRCEKFDITTCTADDFKVLMFVQGLNNSRESLTLEKLLIKLDNQESQVPAREGAEAAQKLKLQDIVNYANRLSSLKVEKSMVLSPENNTAVLAVQQKKPWRSSIQPAQQSSGGPQQNQRQQESEKKAIFPCRKCGAIHFHSDCPFRDKECYTCKKLGHKSGYCASSAYRGRNKGNSRSSLAVQSAKISTRKFVEPTIDNKKLRLQLDSGSDWTIISKASWKLLGSPALTSCEEQALSASGDPVKMLGTFTARLKLHGREDVGKCYVAASNLNVLGSDWMEALDLWSVPIASVCNKIEGKTSQLDREMKEKFPVLFDDALGLCNKMKASMTLKEGAKPIFRKKRPVPFAAAEPIANELKRLHLLGVISPVEFSEYAAPLVAVKKKDGRTRICADYSTGLNDSLEPNQYPLPTPEEIFSKLSQYRVFSKIDLSDAFLQVELDDEAKKMLTINTHCGLFQVNRLQPGIKTAPGIFQQLIDTMMSGAEGAFPFIDDFIVGGVDEDTHRKNLLEVLKRIQDYGFHLKMEKCSFGQKKLEFLGHIIDANGLRPNPEKIEMLKNIPPPEDVQQLQAFLGAVTWYGKFVPHLKNLRGPLDELLCKDVRFEWKEGHQETFEKLKNVLASDLVLTHYDPLKKIIVAADASSYGMGAVLMHEMPDGTIRPIMHAASSFTKAEKNYPQVQREALALMFALRKFHRYIYGRKFELQTDHQPLLAIFGSKKGIPVYTASRLQRYALVLLTYNFTIKYIDTKSFAYADFISRLISKHDKTDEDVVIGSMVNVKNNNAPSPLSDKVNVKKEKNAPGEMSGKANVKNDNAPTTSNVFDKEDGLIAKIREHSSTAGCYAIDTANQLPVTFEALKFKTMMDETLRKVSSYIDNGWPKKQSDVIDQEASKFFIHRGSLVAINSCVFYGDRIVIPACYRKFILNELHEGHPGESRMKMLARSKVYWPSIDSDIKHLVKGCEICATAAESPIKCSLQSWPMPQGPWSRIHVDYAGPVNGFWYFVIIDAFSKWPEVFKMQVTTSKKTIDRLEEVFSRHGLCDTIISDNGPQFVSKEFESFCSANGIEHIRTAPYHPQSNGQAERFVRSLKIGLSKLEGEGNTDQVLRKFLLCYRFTPSFNLGMKSPFQLMTGRVMKTKLDLLKPKQERSGERDAIMEQQFNTHHGAKWKEFTVGDEVFIKLFAKNKWKWSPGVVTKRCGSVNYLVQTHTLEGERESKVHANQMKMRFTFLDDSDNVLLEDFDISGPFRREIEPEVVPEPDADGDSLDDAQEFSGEGEDYEERELPRRSTRATAGIPPQRYGYIQLFQRNEV